MVSLLYSPIRCKLLMHLAKSACDCFVYLELGVLSIMGDPYEEIKFPSPCCKTREPILFERLFESGRTNGDKYRDI